MFLERGARWVPQFRKNMATVPGETARKGLILLGEPEDERMEGRRGEKWRPEGVS